MTVAGAGSSICDFLHPRELLQRDEAVLQQLLQQEIKKKESLKAAEVKVTKLREQLVASERIVGANKTLLRKLQEQVRRVAACGGVRRPASLGSRQTFVTVGRCRELNTV